MLLCWSDIIAEVYPNFYSLNWMAPPSTENGVWLVVRPKKSSNTYQTINAGKSNEQNPEQAAQADYDRIINKKLNEGYVRTDSLESLPDLHPTRNIDLNNIPVQFCCSKPHTSISTKALDKLIQSGNAQFYIKYNGLCHYILVDLQNQIKIYTRRWHDHTVKHPEIVQDVKDLNLYPGTLLIAELVIDPNLKLPHMKAFSIMSSISKSDTIAGKCAKDQTKTKKLLKQYRVRAAVFGILYDDNKPVWRKSYGLIRDEMESRLFLAHENQTIFIPTEVPIKSAAQAIEIVKKNKTKIEGLIVWDLGQAMTITMNGKPDRSACYKIKAKGEKDVIAVGYEEGRGKLQGKIGSLKIGQYGPQGEWIDLGTVGGLKPKKGECDPANWSFPCVIEVEYDQIFPDTGRFQFGHFTKPHEDKVPEDVDILVL